MEYWIIITNDENWKILEKLNIWGTSEKNKKRFYDIHEGDRCLIYIKSNPRRGSILTAEYEVTSEVYIDNSKIFYTLGNLNEVFPYRIKLKLIKLWEKPVDFKGLVPQLSFIRNKKQWGMHLFGAPVKQIPKEDYEMIISKSK